MTNAGISKSTELKIQKLQQLKAKKKMQDELPHLYGYKLYPWVRRFRESFAKVAFLSAPNQTGKSLLCGMAKCVDWATDPNKWPKISKLERPTLFFYFYPDLGLARREIQHKWIPQVLPRGDMKDHPLFGWKLTDNQKKLAIQFNSGVEVVFCGYSQGKASLLALAASSPAAIFIDEEMDPILWPEVSMRTEATEGCINFFATPVECYPFYRDIFNRKSVIPNALVMTASLYDCLKFEDGSPGLYTREKIEARKAKLGSQAEIDKRVFGRYVTPDGIIFSGFDRSENYRDNGPLPKDWMLFGGVDPGSGGVMGHPSAICIVAVNQDFSEGRVYRFWKARPEDGKITALQALEKYMDLTRDLQMTRQFYDWASADFGTFAMQAGVPFEKADKSHEHGIPLINSLFKNKCLSIDEDDEHLPLISELESLRHGIPKRKMVDDGVDALRYAITKLPWRVKSLVRPEVEIIDNEKKPAHREQFQTKKIIQDSVDEEIDFWNEQYEG